MRRVFIGDKFCKILLDRLFLDDFDRLNCAVAAAFHKVNPIGELRNVEVKLTIHYRLADDQLTSGFGLLIPLMVTSPIAYVTAKVFEPYSVYTRQLAQKGKLKTHNKDKYAIRQINFLNLLDKNVRTVPLNATLRQYVDIIADCKRNIFVVVDDQRKFVGLLLMDEHRDTIFKQAYIAAKPNVKGLH